MKTIVRLGLVILAIGLAAPAVPAANESQVPQLLVQGKKKAKQKEPLRMSGLEIDVEVLGHLATTTLTMTFRNDLDRVLEGELVFPLGDGESVSRFAMSMGDIDTLREGVVVEKARGRQIFESTVRKQIDPGLLEMTKGNNFRSRVYPIPAKGEKRIVVGYEGTLRDAGDHFLYNLPLLFDDAIDRFKVDVRAVDPGGAVDFSEGLLGKAALEIDGAILRARMERSDHIPAGALTMRIPKGDASKIRSFVHTEIKRDQRTTYFHSTVPIEQVARTKPKPAAICLLWDASGSASQRDTKAELAALGAYLSKLGAVKVSLVVFRDRPETAKEFVVAGGDWSKLRGRLQALRPDGGTRFGALELTKYAGDEFVLVSDGLATFGQGKIKLGARPVIAINSSPTADHGYLRSVARATGGQYVNLTETDAATALTLMEGQRLAFLGVEGGDDRLKEVYPSSGAPVDGGSFSLAGVLSGEPMEVTLKFGYGGEVTQRRTLLIGGEGAAQSARAKRLWAEAKIAELGLNYEENEDEIVGVAKAHGVVTRGTSLLVLDSIDDYVEHRVIPPKEMQKEYFERIEAAEVVDEAPLREHLEQVVARFGERREWYDTNFPGLEAALVSSAEFEVERAKLLVKNTGLRIIKKRKVAAESLAPAERMLEEAKGLAAQAEKIDDDEQARAAWQKRLLNLQSRLVAFSEKHDEQYPEFDRATLSGDGDDDPFGGEGTGGGGHALLMEVEPVEDPFADVEARGGAALRRRGVPSAEAPGRLEEPETPADDSAADPFGLAVEAPNGFPITPANPADPDAEFAPAELPPASADGRFFGAAASEGADRGGEGDGGGRVRRGIALKKWDPEMPYLKEMKRAQGDEVYAVYLKARRSNQESSAFYLDVADHFIEIGRKDLAVRALSNIAEMELESAPLLRILGHRLLQIGEAELAAGVFEEVLVIRAEEPQSYRDLAHAKMALGDNQGAAELLWEVARERWSGRFGSIDQIALNELNRLIARGGAALKPEGMDASLAQVMPVDLRVVLTWDADNTDIDLWVIDPSGEVCKYDHDRTVTGGRISDDLRLGYGPEEFVIKDALPGEYTIKAHYYGNQQQTLAGATTIQAEITTGFGRPDEETKAVTLRLREEQEVVEVGKVVLK